MDGNHETKVMAVLAAIVPSFTIGLAREGAAAASGLTSGAASPDSCSTWATGSWVDNCQVSTGSSSFMVMAVQWIVSGACGGNGLTLDGNFGTNTQHAVECFQHQNNITNGGGVVGARTWPALQSACLDFVNFDAGWDYYETHCYFGQESEPFRKWDASGKWYVLDASDPHFPWVAMTS
jgi:hypothetical protein